MSAVNEKLLNVFIVNGEQTRNKPVLLNRTKFCYQNHVEEITS